MSLRPFCASPLLHLAVWATLSLGWHDQAQLAAPSTNVAFIAAYRAAAPGAKVRSSGKARPVVPVATSARLSNTEPFEGTLNQQLSATNYLNRVRGIVEPVWRRQTADRVRILAKARLPYKGTSCIQLLLSASGATSGLQSTQTHSDAQLHRIALQALDCQWPPPPKNLLQNANWLDVRWCFSIQ